ncbi:hypothetical protein D3C76_1837100 [compost metagenome]
MFSHRQSKLFGISAASGNEFGVGGMDEAAGICCGGRPDYRHGQPALRANSRRQSGGSGR